MNRIILAISILLFQNSQTGIIQCLMTKLTTAKKHLDNWLKPEDSSEYKALIILQPDNNDLFYCNLISLNNKGSKKGKLNKQMYDDLKKEIISHYSNDQGGEIFIISQNNLNRILNKYNTPLTRCYQYKHD